MDVYSNRFNGVEYLKAHHVDTIFGKHVHAEYSVCVIERGAQRYQHRGETKIASKGDIAIVNPDEVHTGEKATAEGWTYRAIYPNIETLQTYAEDLNLRRLGMPFFSNHVIQDKALAYTLLHTLNEVENGAPKLLVDTLFHSIFIQLLSKHANKMRVNSFSNASSHQTSLAKEYIREFFKTEISAQDLSNLTQLNASHLIRSFKKHYGISPHSYQIQLRVEHAKALLQQGISITDAATISGFYDQSHLHRFFKKTYGMTPKAYKNQSIIYNL